jgi:dihydrolipoamide dehydrogenase
MNEAMASGESELQADLLVLGGGPGGYTAAFRAADLGLQVVLVERGAALGGVCLNVGCIPSKALLHAVETIHEAEAAERMGIHFQTPRVDLEQLRAGKEAVVNKLTTGLAQLARQRKVTVVRGEGRFEDAQRLTVDTSEGVVGVGFKNAIIACGSRPTRIPGFPHDDPRLIDSTGALALEDVPGRMLIVGGGIIGLEMATVYHALGSSIDIVELQPSLIPGCDRDLVRPLQKVLTKRYNQILLSTAVKEILPRDEGLEVIFEGEKAPEPALYDKILVAVGRTPNGGGIAADRAGVAVDRHGFIAVDEQQRTNVPHIYAVGDVTGGPMLAHKATHEAHVAAEVIAGHNKTFRPVTIPAVAYTHPEVAWAGQTETELKEQGIDYEKAAFPWAASGRAIGIGHEEGMTRLLLESESRRILGVGIVGYNAGELIGEAVLALEKQCTVEDLTRAIHPHPTLNETMGLAAEVAQGTITDLMPPRRRKRK